LDSVAFFDFFAGGTFGDVEGVGKLGELFVDGVLLEGSTVGGETHFEGDGVTFGVFPVGDAGRDLPVLLVFDGEFSGRGVHDGGGRGSGSAGDLFVLEFWRGERVDLGGLHFDDALLGAGVEAIALLFGSVFYELSFSWKELSYG
jgi:hypothetical protein